jgi:hypothetical protein
MAFRHRLRELAQAFVPFGYRRPLVMMAEAWEVWNHRFFYRVYTEEDWPRDGRARAAMRPPFTASDGTCAGPE